MIRCVLMLLVSSLRLWAGRILLQQCASEGSTRRTIMCRLS